MTTSRSPAILAIEEKIVQELASLELSTDGDISRLQELISEWRQAAPELDEERMIAEARKTCVSEVKGYERETNTKFDEQPAEKRHGLLIKWYTNRRPTDVEEMNSVLVFLEIPFKIELKKSVVGWMISDEKKDIDK